MYLLTIAATSLAVATPATNSSLPFAAVAVSDDELAKVSGTASPYASLTRRSLVTIADSQSRNDFRGTGAVASVQMEVWWGTIGSELIANAVRNAP